MAACINISKSGAVVRRERITTEWRQARQQLHKADSNGGFSRSIIISVYRSPKAAVCKWPAQLCSSMTFHPARDSFIGLPLRLLKDALIEECPEEKKSRTVMIGAPANSARRNVNPSARV